MSELPLNGRGPGEPRSPEDDDLDLAALHALGALDEEERRALEQQRSADPAFWAEVRSYGAVVEALEQLPVREASAAAPRDLWPEIRARIQAAGTRPAGDTPASEEGIDPEGRSQVWKRWQGEVRADTVRRGQEGAFEPTDVPGITVRRLFVDVAGDRVTMLVRMSPGTLYPAHRHGGAEECYVLEGDLEVGEAVEMSAGDYQRMDAGSLHPVQSTRGGCLLLISGSRHDELVA